MIHTSRLSRAKPVLKYFGVFVLGAVVGGGLVLHFAWGVMAKLMGVEAQMGYSAVERSVTAYDIAAVLSHWRLAEDKEAVAHAERKLDLQMIKAAAAAKDTRDVKVKKTVNTLLGTVKRYRKVYPAQTEFKSQVNQVLASIPDLPEPKQKLPDEKLNALYRLYQRHQNR